jgi:hypothetical protein
MAFLPPPLTLRRQVAANYYTEAMRKLSNLYQGRIPQGLRVLVFDDDVNNILHTMVTEDDGIFTTETHTYGDGTDYDFIILPGTSELELQTQVTKDFNSQWTRLNRHSSSCNCGECNRRKHNPNFKMSPRNKHRSSKKKHGPSKRHRSPKK